MNDVTVQPGKTPHFLKLAAETSGIALVYALLGWLGQSLAIPPGNVTVVWPPSGFALAIALLLGKRAWVGIWLGAFIINTQAFFDSASIAGIAVSLAVGTSIGFGSLIQPVVGAILINRFAQSSNILRTVKSCLVFVGITPFICLVSSTVGAVGLYFGGFVPASSFGELWLTWWLGDSVGVLVLAPFIIAWYRYKSIDLSNLGRLELAVVFSLLVLFAFIGLGNVFGDGETHYPIEFAVWPFLLWLALRFNSSLAITGMLALCVIAIWYTMQGSGPFQLGTTNQSLLVLQLFIFVTAVSVMIVASLRNERAEVEQSLRTARYNLEAEVKKQTAELSAEIVERKQAEREHRKSEERLSIHIQNTPLGCISWDLDFKCTEWNKSAQKIFGYTADEAIGKHPSETIVPAEIKDEIDSVYKLLLAQKGGSQNTNENTTKDGGIISCEWYNTPIIDQNGAVTGVASLILDITERKNLESQLRQAQKMEAVGHLTGGIAHDFNNILGVIMGNLEIAKQRGESGADISKFLDTALEGTLRGANITRGLLGFSRREAGKTEQHVVNESIINLKDLITKSLTVVVNMETHLAGDLWGVKINVGDFEDALLNLSLNARDAMPEGGRLIIKTENKVLAEKYLSSNSSATAGEYVLITFSDTGTGMTKEVQEKLFEPFFTTKEFGMGSGLGLSMVYGFVERSGGHIEVTSEQGSGSTFRIFLPRAIGAETDKEIAGHAMALPTGAETILVVDDEEAIRDIAVNHLQELGYSTHTADNGDHAIEALKQHPEVDLLFCDVIMPGDQTGFQVAHSVHQTNPALKILLTSGYSKKHGKDQYSEILADNLLNKPYNFEELAFAVRRALDAET